MDGGREKDHLLALKVMRLTRPSLTLNQPVICAPDDLPQNTLLEAHRRDLATVHGLEQFALGELLTLPQNFGNIFLGEIFSSYISVHNDSNFACTDIQVKADLQTSSQRLALINAQTQTATELLPQQSVDKVINHEVKELGTHILVCAVSYTTHDGEKMYFRKFFKFQVLKPLDVKTKFYNTETDLVYLEAQIQNITPGPIYMEKVSLEPMRQYTSQDLNHNPDQDSGSVFGQVAYMNPVDTRQYLYCLTPRPEVAADPKLLKEVTSIGKLDIVWRTNMAEKGRLQTSALQRAAPGHGDIRVTVESIPEVAQLEETFKVKFKVANCCERTMDLTLVLQNQNNTGLQWCDISGKSLGQLPPGGSTVLDLNILALHPGLQTISGLRLTDTFLNRTYEHDDTAQIFVYSAEDWD